METLLGGLMILIGFLSAFAYLPVQVYTAIKWSGIARIAALVPLALMVPVIVATAQALAHQSNLWPILLIFAAPVGTGYLLALMLIRHFFNRPAKSEVTELCESN
jgi:hypothetical protein